MNRWAWVLTLALFGCECGTSAMPDGGGARDASAEPPDAAIELPDASAGALRLTLEGDFGAVVRGQSKSHLATFSNESGTLTRITALATTSPAFRLDDAAPFDVPAGATVQRSVTFAPDALGPSAGRLQFSAQGAVATVTLGGLGVGPSLELSPQALDLGVLGFYDGAPAIADAGLRLENVGLTAPASTPTSRPPSRWSRSMVPPTSCASATARATR